MAVVEEMRLRARHVIGPVLGICAVVYFAYHAVHGDRGFLSLLRLEHEVSTAEAEAQAIAAERQAWERQVNRLRPESLDPDVLDEQARRMLAYAAPGDIVILTDRGQ